MKSYFEIVQELVGEENVIWGNANGPLSKINFKEGFSDLPTEEQIQAKLAECQAEYDANQYQRDRAVAYPSVQDQLDMQYWDQVNGTTTWKDAVAKVKADNPKP